MGQTTAGSGERQSYPEDRFDRVVRSGRVGAHRVISRPRYVWQYVIAGLLGFALLTTLGVLAVHSVGSSGKLPALDKGAPVAQAAKTEPELDPNATVAVINGSEIQNLAAALDKIIVDEEWGQILFSGSAATTDVAISAVFYSDPADAEAAAGLAAKLGGLSTYTTEDYKEYGAQLVVLLGADYAGPGHDEAAALTAAGEGAKESSSPEAPEEGVEPNPAGEADADSEPQQAAEGGVDGVPEAPVENAPAAPLEAPAEAPVDVPAPAPAEQPAPPAEETTP
ncbi:hypothetical protein JOF28_002327 [Leucobacter exalbidus]|uniref:LytR/CpsA/Psr regulator C-terminal domain-containing protein n=1 Tax=Leucobacter exalbidus TaxID=662960 RepID=A0A940PVP3_9MICO|nr:hypothetical protein [Leucobacter exalbidus]